MTYNLTPEICHELIDLDKESGIMTWRIRGYKWFKDKKACLWWNKRYAGKQAFTAFGKGYNQGVLLGKNYYAHRLIWFMITGEWPKEIDHINGVRNDNSWGNLRLVDRQENSKNQRKPKNNTSGQVGVSLCPKTQKWRAFITENYKTTALGYFDTFQEACFARLEAERKYGYHENHGRGSYD